MPRQMLACSSQPVFCSTSLFFLRARGSAGPCGIFGWPLKPLKHFWLDLSGPTPIPTGIAANRLRDNSHFPADSTSQTVCDSKQRPADVLACFLRLRTPVVGWPQLAPMSLRNPRFAKGLLFLTATMIRGARSRTPANCVACSSLGLSSPHTRSERFAHACNP